MNRRRNFMNIHLFQSGFECDVQLASFLFSLYDNTLEKTCIALTNRFFFARRKLRAS